MRNRPRSPARETPFSRIRRPIALVLAVAAMVLAGSGYVGAWVPYADYVAALLPFALPLGLLALPLAYRSWTTRLLALVALALCLGRVVPEWLARPEPDRAAGTAFTVITHNIHHGGSDPAAQAEWLAHSGADILLLQENDRRSAAALRRLAGVYPYRDACGACELAILSKWPIEGGGVHWRLPGPDGHGHLGPALFRADVRLPGGQVIRVATIHAPRPLPPQVQAAFFAELTAAMQQQRPRAFILAGDFNQTPWSHTMRQLDHDLLPMRRISRARFTYPAGLPVVPIDQIFASPDLGIENVALAANTGSDHRPLRISVRIRDNF